MQRIEKLDHLSAGEQQLRALLVSGLAGDAHAYHAFLQQLSAHLRAFLRGRLSSLPDEVEDLVQESLLAIHNQRHTYEASRPVTAWIHAIARYKLIDFLRRRAGREALNDSIEDESELFAASDIEASSARYDVTQLLDQLPDRHRLPIVCVKLEGLSVSEAAQKTGMSESAIKVGIHRGLKALAEKIRGTE
jgi:RNA polymerase sigma-70 factor (ECF subfamily)